MAWQRVVFRLRNSISETLIKWLLVRGWHGGLSPPCWTPCMLAAPGRPGIDNLTPFHHSLFFPTLLTTQDKVLWLKIKEAMWQPAHPHPRAFGRRLPPVIPIQAQESQEEETDVTEKTLGDAGVSNKKWIKIKRSNLFTPRTSSITERTEGQAFMALRLSLFRNPSKSTLQYIGIPGWAWWKPCWEIHWLIDASFREGYNLNGKFGGLLELI